jgi:hypothetical protein
MVSPFHQRPRGLGRKNFSLLSGPPFLPLYLISFVSEIKSKFRNQSKVLKRKKKQQREAREVAGGRARGGSGDKVAVAQ